MNKLAAVFKDLFVTHWRAPDTARGKYVTGKEYVNVFFGVAANYASQAPFRYISFAASCYLIMYHYSLPYLSFSVISLIGLPLSYLWNLLDWYVQDNLGLLPKRANRAMFRAEAYEYYTNRLKPDTPRSFFSRESSGNSRDFMDELEELLAYDGGTARFSIITGNHDEVRLRRQRNVDEIKVALACIFTLPGRPFLYYGDEIGMKYLPQVGNIEGSYWRGGSRSPMQWEKGEKAGFSAADPAKFYIMLDPDLERPCVAEQENDPDSLLNYTRLLIKLRHTHPALGAEGKLRRLVSEHADSPLVYERELDGERFIVAVNPAAKARKFEIQLAGTPEKLVGVGDVVVEPRDGTLRIAISGVSAGVFRLHDREEETF